MTADFPDRGHSVSRVEISPGYSIARIINGCWQLSAGHGGNTDSEDVQFRRFHELVDAGFTCFDCADIYTGVEKLLGKFIRQSGLKDRVQVHTKFVPDLDTLATLNRVEIGKTIDRSLTRLGLEQLDLVQFHWWDYSVPGYLEALDVLGELQKSGKIRALGLTNFDTQHLQDILAGPAPVASMQLQFSLLDRRPMKGMVELCRSNGVSLLCYGALAGGLLSDRYLGRNRPTAANRSVSKYQLIIDEAGGWQSFQQLLMALRSIADEMQSNIASVAARWVLEQAGVEAVILGLGGTDRKEENRRMLLTSWKDSHSDAIDRALEPLSAPPGDVFELERIMDGPHAAAMKMNLNAEAKR